MMTALTITAFLVATVYMAVAIWKRGELPETISDMVYWHPKNRQWIWSAWLVTVALLLFAPLTEKCGWVGWLAEVCLLGSALTPLVCEDTRTWHKWLGVATGILSQVCVTIMCPWWLLLWFEFVTVASGAFLGFNDAKGEVRVMNGKGVFVAECVCTVTLCGAMMC